MPNWRTLYWMIEWAADTQAQSSVWQNKKHIINHFCSIYIPCKILCIGKPESCVDIQQLKPGQECSCPTRAPHPCNWLAAGGPSARRREPARDGLVSTFGVPVLHGFSTPRSPSNIPFFSRHISKVDENILVPLVFSRRENPGLPNRI